MKSSSTLPILMYHGVDARPSVVTLHPDRFRWQIEWLNKCGYNGISLGELVRCIAAGESFPARAVVLTFDDGYQNLYTEAFPILRQYGFSATVFLVAGFCNKDNRWPSQPLNIPTMKLLTWEQIGEMARFGIEFGSHTINHPRLDRLPANTLHHEVVMSKVILEDRLGRPITTFAYPYGQYSEVVRDAVRNTYDLACGTQLGLATPTSDPYVLERVEAGYLSQRWVFQQLFHPIFPYYLSIRNVGRVIRSAILSRF